MCDECSECLGCDYNEPLIGQYLPDLEMQAFWNNEIKDVKLSDFSGKWLALVFYPADFTFVCPTELEDLANLYEDFRKEGCEVASVSCDTTYAHLAWHESSKAISKVKYPMIADPTGELAQFMNVYLYEQGLSLRGSFLIDPDGVIRTMTVNSNGIGRSGDELLRTLRAAKFVYENGDQVCPANWKPGEKTLKPGDDLVGKI